MTFQEHEHPRANGGRWAAKEQSEAAGITLGASAGAKPKPIIARVDLQKWDGGKAVEVGSVEFDAAPILAGLTPEQCADMDYGTRDQIFEEAMRRGFAPLHDGPFEVDVKDALGQAMAENPGYFDEPYPHERTARHPDVPLEAPLSAYELGYRIDEDNRVQALAVLDLSEMMDNSSEENWDTVSTAVVGNDLLRDMFHTPVSITSDNQVVYRIEGDAEAVIECMDDDALEMFAAGQADAAADRKA